MQIVGGLSCWEPYSDVLARRLSVAVLTVAVAVAVTVFIGVVIPAHRLRRVAAIRGMHLADKTRMVRLRRTPIDVSVEIDRVGGTPIDVGNVGVV